METAVSSADLPTSAYPVGAILLTGKKRIEIQTASGRLELKMLQPPGKKAMPASAYLNGLHLK